jgi:hypothetical protein
VVVEAAVGQARFLHELRDADRVDALRAEHPACGVHDVLPVADFVFLGDPRHGRLPSLTISMMALIITGPYDDEHHH